jgi:thiol-disulfide isomerase/thioredoxin
MKPQSISTLLDKVAVPVHSQTMRIGLVILLNLAAVASIARADETLPVLKAGDLTYSNVTVFKVSATDVYFTSDKGLGNAKLKDLNPELQKHFNYNPTNAAAVEKKQKAENDLYHIEALKPSAADKAASAEAAADRAAIRQPGTGKQLWARSFQDRKMPEFVVEKWLTGEPDHRGKFVLIEFWATSDVPCRAAIPDLNRFQAEFRNHLVVIGITDDAEDVVRKMTDPKIEYAVAIDTQSRTRKAMEVTGIPHILIVDPRGIVRWEGFPFLPGFELTDKVVAELINKYSN